jgi:hypothetical protein
MIEKRANRGAVRLPAKPSLGLHELRWAWSVAVVGDIRLETSEPFLGVSRVRNPRKSRPIGPLSYSR